MEGIVSGAPKETIVTGCYAQTEGGQADRYSAVFYAARRRSNVKFLIERLGQSVRFRTSSQIWVNIVYKES